MGHRAAHRRQGRHQLAELISPRLALLVFAAGCARGSITKASKLDVAGSIPSPALEKTPTPRDLPRCRVRRRVAEPATRLGSAGRARSARKKTAPHERGVPGKLLPEIATARGLRSAQLRGDAAAPSSGQL